MSVDLMQEVKLSDYLAPAPKAIAKINHWAEIVSNMSLMVKIRQPS